MASRSGQVIASGDQRSSSTVPVTSAISEAGIGRTPRRTSWQLASARTSRSGLRQSGIQLAVLRARRRSYADVLIGMSASSLRILRANLCQVPGALASSSTWREARG